MALFLPGGAVAGSPSGSVGSIVFSHNRFGSYMRTRVIPTNPSTAAQQTVRNYMSVLTNRWYNVLTSEQRDGWETYGANVPTTNRIGSQIFLTGLNWYVACNSSRLRTVDLTYVDAPPTIFNLASFLVTSLSASQATQQYSFDFATTDDWLLDDGALNVFGNRPQNTSVNYNAQPYRWAGRVLGDTITPPTSPQIMAASFAFVTGQLLYVRFNCCNADGRIGAQQQYSCIAAA